MEPQPGQENCAPGITTGEGDDDEAESTSPLWQAPSGASGQDMVTQPGIEDDRMSEEGVAPLERLQGDLDSITNPGRP